MADQKEAKKIIKKTFAGVVVSAKGNKTLVVSVRRSKLNSKYQKRIAVSKHYKVHDEANQYHEGDKVNFVECRPISKDKRWRVIK
ncbi:MAG: 30S ribosomal protein S17 [Candidatus Buchananbacteria bacterium]|nr:30S ribosomal protein S17 [Candidatus Buchananbacteria bacterium]